MKDKFISFLAKIFVFLLVAFFSYLAFMMVIISLPTTLDGPLTTVLMLVAYIAPVIIGLWVTRKIYKPELESDSAQNQDVDDNVNDLIEKENSTFTVIKEEISCWNWQLVVGGLILCIGFGNLLSSFFFAIVLIVLGLGILSIGVTKYKEKQELQERELKRKIMAAVAKESPSEEKTDPAPNPKPADKKQTNRANTKCQTYKVAGVTHYIENIKNLGVENDDYFKSQRELIAEDMIDERIWKYEFYTRRALLQPEPDNPADPNAIKVIVDCEHVGYIKSGSCSHVHKLIKNHAIADVICTIGGGPYKCVSEEYDDEKDEDVYILEKGETNFFVHLEIYEKADVSNDAAKESPSEDTTVSTPVPKQSTAKQNKSANTE